MRQRIEVARRVGVVFGQRSQLRWDLPRHESFTILTAIHRLDPAAGRARTQALVDQLEMGPQLSTPVRSHSLGQRMRAEIAAARLRFDPALTTAAAVLARVSATAEVRELAIDEPNIEDVVRRIYAAPHRSRDQVR